MSYESILKELALKDERFVVLTAENRALIRNLQPVLKDRFIDFGITEQCMIGAAAGLALRGRIPVVHALATFLTLRPFEFIRTDIGISGAPVKLSGWIPGVLSDGNGPTHQAIEDVSILRGIPNMQVFASADEEDLIGMLHTIWYSPDPAYIRINIRKPVVTHTQPFEIGKAEVFGFGKEVTILTYGTLFEQVWKATELLHAAGIDAGIVNMRSLKPVDEAVILKAASTSELVVTVEDHFAIGGLYSIVAETLLTHQKTANVARIAFEGKWFKPGLLDKVLEYEGMNGFAIARRVKEFLKGSPSDKNREILSGQLSNV